MKIDPELLVTPEARQVIELLAEHGKTARFVGGRIRNILLKRNLEENFEDFGDCDLATDCLPEEVVEILNTVGISTKAYGIAHGTVLAILSSSNPIEVTTLRNEVWVNRDKLLNEQPKVIFGTDWKIDAERRDFTINAIYADLEGNLYDPTGGIEDLRNGKVRFIGNARERIQEDRLRILRYFRFQSQFSSPNQKIKPDPELVEILNTESLGLPFIATERTTSELRKILDIEDAVPVVEFMDQCETLKVLIWNAKIIFLRNLIQIEKKLEISWPKEIRWVARWIALDPEIPKEEISGFNLKFTKKEEEFAKQTRRNLATYCTPEILGYYYPLYTAQAVILIQASREEKIKLQEIQENLEIAKQADSFKRKFPLKAKNITEKDPRIEKGKLLGDELKRIEKIWIRSGFALSKDQLIKQIGQGPKV